MVGYGALSTRLKIRGYELFMNTQHVTIVIPAYNSARTISLAIEACLNQDYPRDLLEIMVVDDGSTDATCRIVQSYVEKHGIRYLYQENSGPATARNNGWKHAQGSIVAFLDSDCVPRKYWVHKMVSHYTEPNIVCVGSRYGIVNRSNLLACCIYFEFLIRYKRMPKHPKFLGSHGYSFRKSFLEEIGGYCEEYKMASHEDNELAYRIHAKNCYTIFDKTNIVAHHFPTNLYKYLRIQMWHGFWRMKLYVHHPRMVTGDDYSDMWDYLQPPLMLLSLILLPFSFLYPIMLVELFLLIAGISLQLPITLNIIALCGKKRYLVYIPFGLMRSASRSIGMVMGITKFWILKQK